MGDMADREQSPAATLGAALSWIGYVWFVFAVLWGLGAIQALGVSGPIASGIGTTIFPAIVMIGVGRAIRRRARPAEDSIRPDVAAPIRIPPILPRTDTSYELPRPTVPTAPKPPRPVTAPRKVADKPMGVAAAQESGEETTPPGLESVTKPAGRPKTSQELIEEARRRWGTRP